MSISSSIVAPTSTGIIGAGFLIVALNGRAMAHPHTAIAKIPTMRANAPIGAFWVTVPITKIAQDNSFSMAWMVGQGYGISITEIEQALHSLLLGLCISTTF